MAIKSSWREVSIILVIAQAACDAAGASKDGDSSGGEGASDLGGRGGSEGSATATGGTALSGGGGDAGGSSSCAEPGCDTACGGPDQPCCDYADACDAPTLSCSGGSCQSCVAAIDTGSQHACALMADGSVWCWGYNAYEQLGFTGPDEVPTPTKISTANVSELHLGNYKTCVRGGDGELACWGYYEELTTPLEEDFTGKVAEPALGLNHTCALLEDGQVWCWGDNDDGQLGRGDFTWASEAVHVTGLGTDTIAIDSSGDANCVRKADGSAWCWGSNVDGQLGVGNMDDQPVPVQLTALGNDVADISVTTYAGCALKTDGSVWCWGDLPPASSPYTTPKKIEGFSGAVAKLALGRFYACAIGDPDGSVWCWGYNSQSQLGGPEPSKTTKAIQLEALGKGFLQIASEFWFTCALREDGAVWCWGYNGYGELGQGHTNELLGPVKVPLSCP